ncbi:uncharacterized protein LOC120135557 isoform X2 [Hibiscus syriacus]|uniref:uncharacterized protein LOC120135557 isoform X2 n=1 Tax=Hibiscus syriacus TaxID=106335 RepID=UPI00192453ED|nr:uncharacterized protein LOC120135557 isoform X2 [Hibiscus syriacus]
MSTTTIACPHKNHYNNTHFIDWWLKMQVSSLSKGVTIILLCNFILIRISIQKLRLPSSWFQRHMHVFQIIAREELLT